MPDWVKDRLKEALSLILSGLVPAGTLKWPQILPFVNSQIAADLSVSAGIFAVIVGLFSCVYARLPRPPAPATPASVVVAMIGLGASLVGLLAMVFLTSKLVPIDPGWESFAIRVAYLLLVIGAGAPL